MKRRFNVNIFNMALVALVAYLAAPTIVQTVLDNEDFGGTTVLMAGEGGGGVEAPPKRRSLLRVILIECGVWMWFLIILSVVAFAFSIRVFVEQRPEKLLPPGIEDDFAQIFDEEDYERALDLCDDEDCMATRIVAAGLARMESGYDAMMEAVDEVGEQEATIIFQKLSYISLIAAVSPMLGLLGTVVGMISAFNKIVDTGGAANPAHLAGGISTALFTTAGGLLIAIPTSACFMFLKNRSVRVVMDTVQIVHDLFERFRNK